MGVSDQFFFSATWLASAGNSGDDDDVELGNTDDITPSGQENAMTVIINSVPLGAAFAVKNTSTLFGEVLVV